MSELLPTYAENIRVAGKKRRMNPRQLSSLAGYSYEHMRKIWQGRTAKRDNKLTVSRECNDILCDILGLPADAMFELAEREKFSQVHGYAPLTLPDPIGRELSELWDTITEDQKEVLLRMARSFSREQALAS